MQNDPWKHCSEEILCATCIWYIRKEKKEMDGKSTVGRCRRHSPGINGYPVVFETDWCGDHRLSKNVI